MLKRTSRTQPGRDTTGQRHLAELINQALDLILISRNLERVADHTTDIAKDLIFWSAVATDRHHGGMLERRPINPGVLQPSSWLKPS